MKTTAIFLILVGSALSAPDPNGCIESCFNKRLAGLRAEAQNGDYLNKPGNWSEHNQYVTDGGHGKVHEEHGQYQDTSKHLRYFRKNYSASYGSGDAGSIEHFGKLASGSDVYGGDGYNLFEHSGHEAFQAHAQRVQSFLESQNAAIEEMRKLTLGSSASHHNSAARLEDLGHSENTLDQSQLHKHIGGTGYEKGFEEHGQAQHGPTHIKYYKKNYTASFQSTDLPVSSLGLHDSQGYQNSYGREIDSQNSRLAAGSANYGHESYESSKKVHEVPATNANQYRGYYSSSDTLRGDQPGLDNLPLVQPHASSAGVSSGSAFQKSASYPSSNYQRGAYKEESSVQGSGYQSAEIVPEVHPGHVRSYEESHNHHTSYKETVPRIGTAAYQLARYQAQNHGSGFAHHSGYAHQSGYSQQSSFQSHGRNTYVGQENSAGHIFGSPSSEKLVAGMLDLGHTHNADCVHESNQAQYSSQYMRKH